MANDRNTSNEFATPGKPIGNDRKTSSQTPNSRSLNLPLQTALLILILLTLSLAGGGRFLLQRQLWMDEIHSWLLITDSDSQRSLQALADGVDFNPPTYILLARQLQRLPGGITEFRLRLFSLGLMLLAIAGIFVLLRRRFPLLICTAAILLMVSSVHLIHQAAEVRFYPLWCAACAWLCVVLDLRTTQPAWWQRTNNVAAVLLAGIMTTTHYFGILSLGLICMGAMWMPNPSRSRRWMIVLVALTGSLCLAACLPFLMGQRTALTRSTWVSPATLSDSFGFLTAVVPVYPLIVCGVAFLISLVLQKSQADDSRSINLDMSDLRSLAPGLMLALMPLVIVLVSWTLQPALVSRYAVTGMLGFGVVFAVLMSRCGTRMQVALVVAGGAFLLQSIAFCSHQWREVDELRDALVDQLRRLPPDGLIVFEDRTVSMPVLHSHPELRARCALVDFSDDQLSGDSSLRTVQRDVGRRIMHWYPDYTMRSLNSLSQEATFYVVPYADSQPTSLRWPTGFRVTHISPTLDRHDQIVDSPAN